MSVLSTTVQSQVEEDLVQQGLLTTDQLEDLRERSETDGTPLFSMLVSENIITDEDLTRTTAKISRVPYVNLSDARIDVDVLALLPQDIAERYMAVPLGEMQHRLVVAMLDADNVQAADFLANKIGRPLKVYSASEAGIKRVLKQYTERLDATMIGELKATVDAADGQAAADKAAENTDGIQTIVQDSPISKALSTILEYAAKNRASDIHIEPLEKVLKIRARIDGVLREIMKLPKSTEAPLVSRIKILANLKIDEHRIPQDGGFAIVVDTHAIDLRISISPVVWGEQVVIRLLDKSGTSLNLIDMGYHGRALRTIKEALKQPNGMILTSGPTGSGKSTSLYALIQEIMDDTINIVTLEDPVEYKMQGINQIQVNA
ncbi:MAG: ATPase, T2SS/T4P/T4SS family, partial [Candidatus Saccharibacteria bacterium]